MRDSTSPLSAEAMTQLHRALLEAGKLIEAGWVGLRLAAIPADAPAVQLDEMRNAFFAGANHLFASIMVVLDPGAEPTDADLERFTMISAELDAFLVDFEERKGLRMKEAGHG